MISWVDTGGYGAILAGNYPLRSDDATASWTEDVSAAARHYKDGFDQSNDPLIRGIRDGLGGVVDGVGQAATSAADSMGRKISEWRRNARQGED
ncbi:hypothetical protein BHQ19_24400 [Mycolicibacterium porcinum]|nr:hypothetical protein BHQ19_24400 [Mycolicibacterium porcinum]